MNHAHVHALLRGGPMPPPPGPRFDTTAPAVAPAWLSVAEFGYDRVDEAGAMLQLMAALDAERGLPAGVTLQVESRRRVSKRLESVRWIRPSGSAWSEHSASGVLLWQVSFDLPLEVVRSPRSLFTLTASNRLALALPSPRLREDLLAMAVELPRRRVVAARVRRSAVAFTAGLAAAAAVGSAGGAALAGTISTSSQGNGAAVTSTDTTTTGTDTTTTPTDTTTTPTDTTTTPTDTTTTPTAPAPPTDTTTTTTPPPPTDTTTTTTTTTAPTTDTTTSTPAPGGSAASPGPTAAPPASTPPATSGGPSHAPAPAKSTTSARSGQHHKPSRRTPAHRAGHRHTSSLGHRHGHGAGKARHLEHRSASTSAGSALLSPISGGVTYQNPFSPAELSLISSLVGTTEQPPAFLIPIYKAAGHRYHIPWRILAAINAIETNFGRNLNVSSAGAEGWMQFMPGTWARYGVDVTGHGRPNPYDPRDAIFAAARYLAANGGQRDLRRAIFAYNHALWYVDAVLWRAQTITGAALKLGRDSGYALPLDARYMHELGRTDDGVDVETAPDGTAVYSITPGVVTAVASDPSGFGPDYPVVLVTSGPLAGQCIYYGHVAASLVKVGQHVIAGQPIAVMGHTGDAASLGHGHIEIGFSTSGGDPLNHHAGAGTAWTPSGAAMRSLLVALSHGLGIKNS